MYRKCYSTIAAKFYGELEKSEPFRAKWHPLHKVDGHSYIMVRHSLTGVRCAPMLVLRFPFCVPRTIAAEIFCSRFTDEYPPFSTADKLRFYRHKKSLLQREVAEAGINESTYIHYENPEHDYYPLDKLKKIAELLEVNVDFFLDDYNRFLLCQSEKIHSLRLRYGLTQNEFGKRIGVSAGAVKKWESGRVRVTKKMWERLRNNLQSTSQTE